MQMCPHRAESARSPDFPSLELEKKIHIGDTRHGKVGRGGTQVAVHVGAGSISIESPDKFVAGASSKTEESEDNRPEGLGSLDAIDNIDVSKIVNDALKSTDLAMAKAGSDKNWDHFSVQIDKMDDLKDLDKVLEKAFKGFDTKMDGLKDLDKVLAKALKDVGPEVEKAMKDAKPEMDKAMKELDRSRPEIERSLKEIKPEVEKALMAAMKELENSMKDLKPKIEKAIKQVMKELQKVMKDLKSSDGKSFKFDLKDSDSTSTI